jgi:spore coat-associated protein N
MNEFWLELERDRPSNQAHQERRRRLWAAAALAALAFLGIGLSSALFTDTQALGSNDLTTGTVRLGTTPGTAAISAGNMAPGDEVFGNVQVENTGSLRLRYALSASADDPDLKGLRTQLVLRTYSGVSPANCAVGDVSLGTLEGGPTTLDNPVPLFGDNAQGSQAGDRALNAGTSEDLCMHVTLPLATTNAYQNATSTITLTFDAEQTANNP